MLTSHERWELPGNSPFKNLFRNWVFVFLYSKIGYSPEQIFRLYYGRDPDPIVEVDADVNAVEGKKYNESYPDGRHEAGAVQTQH